MYYHCPNRSWLVAVSSLAIAAIAARCGAETLPYRAHVAQGAAELRSGPGDDYYVTDTLPEGGQVEVYQERPDGWCAIRPPAESYSWVFARHVDLLAGGLGEINKDAVASRVGGRASDRRDAVQVHLAKGEVVQVLGTDERDGQTWYRIAPPSGEFRWVLKNSLASDGPLQKPEPNREDADAQPAQTDVWRAAPRELSVAAGEEGRVIAASHNEPPDAASHGAAQAGPAQESESSQPASTQSVADASATAARSGSAAQDDLTRQVADLDLRLSQMVAQPAVTWQIDKLEKEGEELLSRATTVAERDAVKPTLAKIDRFAAIHRRYQWSSAAQAAAGVTPQQTSSGVPQGVGGGPAAGQPQYDAVGVLRPVVSKRPGAPQYALVNDQGQVISFVTASPDLNLQPYLGRRVGIVGGRGYIPEFQRAHVTASRVTPLGVGDRVLR